MKKRTLAAASALLLAATPVFACPHEAGGDTTKNTADKGNAKTDAAKEAAPKAGPPASAEGATQKTAPKSTDKKPS